MSDQVTGFGVDLLAGIVLLGLEAALKSAYGKLARWRPAQRITIISAVLILWAALNAAYTYFFPTLAPLFVLISSAALAWIMRAELNQFWRIGLVAADAQIQSGTDFRRALDMATNSLDFLGIGAAKLTGERTAFEAAVQRCQRPDSPVRLLLCRPDNQQLLRMAQSANRDPSSYQKQVLDSLRFIAELHKSRTWNIKVRFYRDFPTFRLMFINDSLCLASHYVLGKGTGAELPQLHVVKLPASQDVDSLYYAFISYFERFWEGAEQWDFEEYL